MKKLYTLLFLLLSCSFVFGQTEKGKFLLSAGTTVGLSDQFGMMGLNFSNKESEIAQGLDAEIRTRNYIFTPKAGFFIANNLVTGLEFAVGWGNSNTSSPNTSLFINSETSLFGVGPFVRYYIPKGKILPFAEISTLFGTSNEDISSSVVMANKSTFTNIGGGLGLAVLLGERFTFDLLMNYQSHRMNTVSNVVGADSIESFNRENGLGLKIGLTVFLGK